ncbi:MAG TPA: BrnA antitoxin family protein [Ktedonobacteraceae bacterium]
MEQDFGEKETFNQLSPEQQAEIEALAGLPDEQIDTQDIPEVTDWSGAKRGMFYRPIKQQITLRLDADVIAWFKSRVPLGEGYQTDINRALREYVVQHMAKE